MEERTVRTAGVDDVTHLVRLRAEMFASMGVPADGAAWQESAACWFRERLTDPGHRFVLVEVEGAVVACAVGSIRDAMPSPSVPAGRDVLVGNVCTDPAHRGRGHGRAAFEAVMAWAAATGVRRVELLATAQGRGMYEAAGFAETAWPAMRATLG
ncbi:GNAT family N-acetyltransferase [Lapillicoccus jejuensis]|uniref:N-acetylglutamate synthase-like GNAT family acetyltransferase n=1 Tax=Lapillicoccus jejuensis TaxID=402171 RepID=A0A542E519_9MICO|nr:GNAT family N-acetyltransferase [Lapillicoccus jejuensis]TQJ10374.1 N-acetylglutamate synthase-like GNAT family acetyltransferase [Lapillicoccus jejuensis]